MLRHPPSSLLTFRGRICARVTKAQFIYRHLWSNSCLVHLSLAPHRPRGHGGDAARSSTCSLKHRAEQDNGRCTRTYWHMRHVCDGQIDKQEKKARKGVRVLQPVWLCRVGLLKAEVQPRARTRWPLACFSVKEASVFAFCFAPHRRRRTNTLSQAGARKKPLRVSLLADFRCLVSL